MQDARALKNPRNLSSWRAWEQDAYRKSGFAVILGGIFVLMFAFVILPSLLGPTLGNNLALMSFVGLILYLGICFALMALAVSRVKAWKRANPWTPPS